MADASTSRPVLVGCDGTPRGDDAIALGHVVADLLGAPIEVVSIHPYAPLSSRIEGDGWTAMTVAKAHAALDRARHRLARRDRVTFRRVPASTPVLGLELAAVKNDAELIVVGSTGRGRIGRLFAGTTAEQLFAHTSCPVAVAPRGYAGRRSSPKVVGVAYDDGPESRRALSFARRLHDGTAPRLRLIGVVDPSLDDPRDRVLHRLQKVAAEVADGEAQLLEGRPAAALAGASGDLDLLVIGSHGRGAARRAVLGSVSSELARQSQCPVVVVPRGAS